MVWVKMNQFGLAIEERYKEISRTRMGDALPKHVKVDDKDVPINEEIKPIR